MNTVSQDNDDETLGLLPRVTINKPAYSLWSWSKFILIRLLVFPFLWDILKFIVNFFAGESVGKRVFLAQEVSVDHIAYRTGIMDTILNSADDIIANKLSVITHDGAVLDTIEIRCSGIEEDNDRPYLINFLGTSQYYQLNTQQFPLVKMMIEDARNQACNVIGFNFRGVGTEFNKPRSAADLVTDGIAQVQRLLNKNVAPSKIVLNGVSLGAGIATLVAKHFHSQGIKLRLFNDRSFSNMTNVIIGWIRIGDLKRFLNEGPLEQRHDHITGYTELGRNIVLGWLAWPFVKLILCLTQWDIDAGSAYARLPESDKACMYIQSTPERKQALEPPVDDCIISSFAQIQSRMNPNDLDAAPMQTREEEILDDGHFKMRKHIVNSMDQTQSGQDFFYKVLNEKFNFEMIEHESMNLH